LRNPNRVVDKTHLSADHADERIIRHRDVNSHAFRWAHIARHLSQNHRYKDAIICDACCGREVPLAKMLYSNRLIPLKYVGIDLNKFEIPEMLQGKKLPITIWPQTDVCALTKEDVGLKLFSKDDPNGPGYDDYALPNVLVCLEGAEHMLPEHTRRMFIKFKEITSDDCTFFISTPCWDRINVADNHLSEILPSALGALFEDLGYDIVNYWGTFASQKDYRPVMEERYPGITKIFNDLSEYYDSTVISTTFAPLFPMESRNILWELTKKRGDDASQDRLFSALEQVPGPWTSHPTWKELNGPVD